MSILNTYMHGYVIIPIFDAFLKKGFFKILSEQDGVGYEELSSLFKVNAGPFHVCLRAFETLNWINIRDERIVKGKDLPQVTMFPNIVPFYSLPLEHMCFQQHIFEGGVFIKNLSLDKFLKESSQLYYLNHRLMSHFLDGVVILPLFYVLQQRFGKNADIFLLDALNDGAADANLVGFFTARGFAIKKENSIVLTEHTTKLLNSVNNSGVTLSYRPMLSFISAILFQDWSLSRKLILMDKHVERTMNVIGSGAQHPIFFEDFLKLFEALFKTNSFIKEHLTFVDVGCGDGTFLKQLYFLGSQYKKVSLVGVDYNELSLIKSNETLKGLPVLLMRGDVAYPEKIIEDIAAQKAGIIYENLVHVRTFLDHDRPYIVPKNHKASLNRQLFSYTGSYVGKNGERLINSDVVQSLVEYFEKWATVIGNEGLFTIESHLLPPHVSHKYVEQAESLHFDTYHGISGQLLLEADVYLLSAAEAGLILDKRFFKKYPSLSSYTRITMQRFLKKNYKIRNAYPSDKYALENLLETSSSFTVDVLNMALSSHPVGQYVLEKDGEIVAALHTTQVQSNERFNKIIFDPYGDSILLLGINFLPGYYKYAWKLLSFILTKSLVKNGIKKVITLPKTKHEFKKTDNLKNMYFEECGKVMNFPNLEYSKVSMFYVSYDYFSWIRCYEKKSTY